MRANTVTDKNSLYLNCYPPLAGLSSMPGDRLFGFKSAAGSLITPFFVCYYGNPHAKSGLSLQFKFRLVISDRSAASLANIM